MGPNPVCFKYYVPRNQLSQFVALFWYWRGHDSSSAAERVLPSGTVEVVIKLRSCRASEARISGPQSRFFTIERTDRDELLGIHFKPGGAFPFFRFPVTTLHNRDSALTDVWGERRADELIDRIHHAPSVEGKFRILERWLFLNANWPLQHHPAVSHAIAEFQRDPAISSAQMADAVGFSQRKFINLFRDEVGFGPKLFCRVLRFQQVIRAIKHRDAVDWADVALSAGYYDQAHFIHDFQEFTGLTPGEYLPLRTDHLNHVKTQA
jgi:AraC-like DNA-binding protein